MFKHGHAIHSNRTPIYESWRMMRRRCLNKKDKNFKDYGGRGITICKRWDSFTNFLADMGERPVGETLERKDNNGNYEPDNCRWATTEEQHYNTRANHLLTYRGETMCTAAWAKKLGINQTSMRLRVKYGFTGEKLFHKGRLPTWKQNRN